MEFENEANEIKYLKSSFLLQKDNFNTHIIEYQHTDLHNHSFYEIVYILNGKIEHVCNGKSTILTIGNAVFLRPEKDTHTYRQIEGEPFLHRDLLIGKELFKKACDFLSPNLFQIINETDEPISLRLDMERILFFEKEFSNKLRK